MKVNKYCLIVFIIMICMFPYMVNAEALNVTTENDNEVLDKNYEQIQKLDNGMEEDVSISETIIEDYEVIDEDINKNIDIVENIILDESNNVSNSLNGNQNLTDGWYESTEGTYYLSNGERATGIQVIEEKKYCFGEDGILQTGFITIGEDRYFFSRPYKYALTGWVSNSEGTWYQDEEGRLLKGIQIIDGKKYYFGEDGILQTGFITIGEDRYFFSRPYKYALTGWVSNSEGTWYQDEEGRLIKGLQEIEEKKYYFGDDGILQTGFITVGEDRYFFSRPYKYALTGWVSNSEGTWYQDEEGRLIKGLQEIEEKKYYFGDDGILQTGFITIGEDRYFFSRPKKYALTGWVSNNEGTWYQDEEGIMIKGLQVIEGKTYYFGDDCLIQTGFITIGEDRYFFSRPKKYALTGWVSNSEGTWYQDEAGKLIKGYHTIDGRDYVFNDETGLLDGFVERNGQKYYYNPDGSQAKGVQYMAGLFWQFNSITGAFEKMVNQLRVIDISSHNGNIDWNRVKASGQVDAVILRLGYGIGYMDTKFIQNKNELERLGIPYSVYLFSYAENGWEALRESNFVIDVIRNNNVHIASNLFGIYYDLEDWEIRSTGENSYGISQNAYREMINTFVDNIERNLCVRARVYASKNYILERFPTDVQGYATWVAQWYHEFTYQGPYEGWQYTSDGSVPGINGRVDMNYFYV